MNLKEVLVVHDGSVPDSLDERFPSYMWHQQLVTPGVLSDKGTGLLVDESSGLPVSIAAIVMVGVERGGCSGLRELEQASGLTAISFG
ncbi:hypothetical protein HQ544_00150 [Candidatus Falkowbacteria bacterium]|nr:hypothetical protein [Candidatus Falkowbacteria bacterium]